MIVIDIGSSEDSPTKAIQIKGLRDFNWNDLDLSNSKDLAFDHRPIKHDKDGYTFDVKVEETQVTFTRTDEIQGWGYNARFRLYIRSEEKVPSFGPFYTYLGVDGEEAPADTIEACVHPSVKIIKAWAFLRCTKMRKCIMDDTVQDIREGAFDRCKSLRTLRLSQKVQKIYNGVFRGCEALDILVIPNNTLADIGSSFKGCTNVKLIAFPPSISLRYVCNISVIDGCTKLLAAKPDDVDPIPWLKQRFRNLPLHRVCFNPSLTTQDILQCIQHHPQSPTQQDDAGMLALHMVSMLVWTGHRDVHPVFCTLYEANREALFVQDMYGCTPLDSLCHQEGNMGLLVALMQDLCVHRVEEHTMVATYD